ncbi:MAG: amidohydrolase family protein [Acidobacteria bacterium]|nr:amidohydrolase family protein [Acidobacteriota bacterium]
MKFGSLLCALAALLLFSVCRVDGQKRTDVYAIVNARIVTVAGPPIEKGTVVVRDGLIESVTADGAAAKIPADARVIDGAGLTVYPGFIDALTNLALPAPQPAPVPQRGQTAPPPTGPVSNSNYPTGLQPEVSAAEQLKGGDAQFETVRANGFTTALTVPRDGIFNGRSALIDLAGDAVSDFVVKTPVAEHFTFRTGPFGVYPSSLMGTFAAFRQMLLDAKRLAEWRKLYAANPKGLKRPDADRSLEALFPVVDGTLPVVFNANTEREIVRVLDLVKEFRLNAMIAGGQEAWKVAARLKEQNVAVLLSLNFPRRTAAASPDADPEDLETLRFRAETPKCAARLAQAGVRFAFQSGGLANPADFFANAAKTTENGLSTEAALRAMTLDTARLFGVDNVTGSIEAGKIANLTVVRGDIFAKERTITHVFVDGRLFEPKEKPKTPTAPNSNAPAVANVGGNYSITVEIPGQSVGGTLALTQQGALLTGTLTTDHTGSAPIRDGKVTSDGFSFAATVDFGGSQIELDVTGKVAGDRISGTIATPQGAIPFSGTKNP